MLNLSSVNTSLNVKYNKKLKALPFGLYESIQLLMSLVTNIALGFTSCYTYLPLDFHLEL